MRSSFFEFHVAISGTFTARSNLEIISHNTANAAIKGYSRQVPLQKANEPLALNTGKGMVGTGSDVYGLAQVRDVFLDGKYWGQGGAMGEYSCKKAQLAAVENVFNEMVEDTGLSRSIADFFARAADVAISANDSTSRTNFIYSADSLAQMINLDAAELSKQQNDANIEVSITVGHINSLGEQIGSLNKQIATQELNGSRANDMRDERARLVDELSRLVNIEAREVDLGTELNPNNKHYMIMLNGYDFVNHYNVNPLKLIPRAPAGRLNPMDADGLYDIGFMMGNAPFDIYHPNLRGQLKGLIDVRDGNGAMAGVGPTTDYKGIPYYLDRLNTLVRNFARAIDEGLDSSGAPIPGATGHVNGFDLYGGQTGRRIFVYGAPPALPFDYNDMTCRNIMLNKELVRDPKLLNCASGPPEQGESAYGVVKGFAFISNNPSLFKEGKLGDFVTSVNSELGIDARQARDFEASYGDMMTVIDNQRIDVSGVDLNEEMINMVKNQQLYQASAKLVSAINSIYDTMINRLGA